MFGEIIKLWETGEYDYPMACGFVPNLVSYMHEDRQIHPCMIIVPGGGYEFVSSREGEIVARRFYDEGYNTFVLTYTTDITKTEPLKLQPMNDLARAIRKIRQGAERYAIDPDRVIVCGFSAGAHLCASLSVHEKEIKDIHRVYDQYSCKPDAMILSYPVVMADKPYAHQGTFEALYGKKATKKQLDYMSIEKQVTKDMPPCFIWHTAADQTVRIENSYALVRACKLSGVRFSFHVFSTGKHGLSLANELWAGGDCGGEYTKEQMKRVVEQIEEKELKLPKDAEKRVLEAVNKVREADEPNEEVSIWPELASRWLKAVFTK